MKYLILFLLSFPASADYYYFRIGAGKNLALTSSILWEDQGELGCMLGGGHVWEITKQDFVDLGVNHYSQCLVGPPVNDKDESAIEALYVIYEQRWK